MVVRPRLSLIARNVILEKARLMNSMGCKFRDIPLVVANVNDLGTDNEKN